MAKSKLWIFLLIAVSFLVVSIAFMGGCTRQSSTGEPSLPVPTTQYSLSTSVSPGGSGTVTPSSGTYDDGTEVTLAAAPASGYTFDHWSGDATGKSSSVSLTMDTEKNVTAHFKTQYALSTSVSPSGVGTVFPASGTYDAGSDVTITATPASGYRFDHWSGDATATSSSVTVTMDGDKTVTAHFMVHTIQNLSDQITGIDIAETTALTSLLRISEELDKARNDGSLSEEEAAELRTDLMDKFNNWVNVREDQLNLNGLNLLPAQGQIIWTEQESTLLEGAAERIDHHRKGDATVLVVNAAGIPVTDAVVHIEMLRHDFLFGANLFMLNRAGSLNQAYGDAFARLFNYATLPFYWLSYEWVQGQEQQGRLTNMALWASDHGIRTKGHPLIWPADIGVPGWAAQFSPEQLDEVQHERVTRIVKNFRGLIDCWDVLNEPTHVDSYQEPLSSWMQAHTPAGATALALEWARASNQEATLLVNDWRNDDDYHTILEDAIASGAQFDAIGLQSHMHVGTWTLEQVWDTCERFKDFNVPLHFTEVTVLSGDLKDDDWFGYHPGWNTTPEGEALQVEYVVPLYTILFSHPSMQAITWWDLSDLGAWQGAPAGLIRKDMSPKPAYEHLMQLIHQEWWTNTDSKTNAQGEAIIRGFYGQYLLTIKSGTRSVQKLIHLRTGHENIFKVQLP